MPLASPLAQRLFAWAQYPLPHHALSRLVGVATRSRRPWIRQPLIHWFVRRYAVDLGEAAQPDPDAYPDFQAFFTRALRPEARPVCDRADGIACPADGTLSQLGRLDGERILQAKGRHFDADELLGGAAARAAPFRDGAFATVYLAPRDYHRVHMPVAGTLREMVHVPGRVFSVNPATTAHVPRLFARNERVVAIFDTAAGPMAVVLVGAMLVATVATRWAGTVTPPRGRRVRRWDYPASGEGSVSLARGEELGAFNLGSTVIVLFGREQAQWAPGLTPGESLAMGQCLGQLALPSA
jgi:phosphatidylserine decarboxylase